MFDHRLWAAMVILVFLASLVGCGKAQPVNAPKTGTVNSGKVQQPDSRQKVQVQVSSQPSAPNQASPGTSAETALLGQISACNKQAKVYDQWVEHYRQQEETIKSEIQLAETQGTDHRTIQAIQRDKLIPVLEKCAAAMEESLRYADARDQAKYQLGILYLQSGQRNDAKKQFNEVFESQKGSQLGGYALQQLQHLQN